jgi:tRNA-2-methylthio-N6-dimethylallyladenosine synthase
VKDVQSYSDSFESNVLPKRVFIETYGCQMNQADSELISGILEGTEWEVSADPHAADVILLNTCAVRERAEQRVIGRVRQIAQLRRYRPDLKIVIVGCMASHLGTSLSEALPEIDGLIGPDSYRRLPALLQQAMEAGRGIGVTRGPVLDLALDREEAYEGLDPTRSNAHSAWIPIVRGCDRFCTFCVVPLVRGRERSVAADEVVRQITSLVDRGTVEVTLLGQTVNSYRDGRVGFAGLLLKVAAIPGLLRIRYTSSHPVGFTRDVLDVMASHANICKHIHIPVQSGSNRVLKSMKRGYTREEFLGQVDVIRSVMPDISLTTDLMTGFPEESDADFNETLSLMREVRFDGAFLFRYSPRPGTFAFRRQPDLVPDHVKAERLTALIGLQEEIARERYARWIGRSVPVLVEGPSRRDVSRSRGKSDDFKTVIFCSDRSSPGTVEYLRIKQATSHTLIAEGVAERQDDEGRS